MFSTPIENGSQNHNFGLELQLDSYSTQQKRDQHGGHAPQGEGACQGQFF